MTDKPVTSDHKEQHKPIQRLLNRWRARMHRDIIAGEVGEGARNVVIGKNIIQIGSVSIPTYFAVFITAGFIILIVSAIIALPRIWQTAQQSQAVVAILSATPTSTSTPSPTPTLTPVIMPATSFNIAVVPMGVVNSTGHAVADLLLRQQTNVRLMGIVEYIRDQATSLADKMKHRIEIWGPDVLEVYQATTDDEAMQLISSLNAHILIYGEILVDDSGKWLLSPKFFVKDPLFDRTRELVGPHALGNAIQYEAGSIFSAGTLNFALQQRLDALITILLAAQNIYEEPPAYARAINILEKFEQTSEWTDLRDGGQEVFFYFWGSAYLGEATITTDPVQRKVLLDKSLDTYQAAVTRKPDYARVHNGIGSVYYTLARNEQGGSCSTAGQKFLELAFEQHEIALAMDPIRKPPLAYVDYFARYNIATVDLSRGYCMTRLHRYLEAANFHENAAQNYTQVLDEYNKIQQPNLSQTNTVINAAGGLARITFNAAYNFSDSTEKTWQDAIQHYQTTLDLVKKSGSSKAVTYSIDIMPEYLVALCKTNQGTYAQSELTDFMILLSQQSFVEDVDKVRQSIIENVASYHILWEECIDEAT